MIFNKVGQGISVKNLLGLLIAVVVLVILASLLFKLLAPSYDEADEIGKSYFEMMKNSFEEAEKNGYSRLDFFVRPNDKARYFLVYFGTGNLFGDYEYAKERSGYGGTNFGGSYSVINSRYYSTDFFLGREAKNTICICSTSVVDAKFVNEDVNKEYGIYSSSKTFDKYYSTEGKCERCLDLEWPLEVRLDNVVLLNESSDFIIRFGKDDDFISKYFLEKNGA